MEEKKERTHVLDGISPGLPALMRAYKLHSKASKVGFDWPDTAGVWEKVLEELHELEEAVAGGSLKEMEHELGDLLFILSGYARHIGLEPETALNAANNRFIKRFGYVEKKVQVCVSCHMRMENNLHQNIAKFFFHTFKIVIINSF